MPRKKPATAPPPDDHAAHEADQARRAAASPLSLHFEVIGCAFATTHHHPGCILPVYTFHPPCPFGKTQPDQDCRMCQHHRIARVGANDISGSIRYPHHGVTVPVTEDQAERVMALLAKEDTHPLTRPHWRKHAEDQERLRAEAEARHAAERERQRAQEQVSPHLPARTE